jgi:hypothetical protein
MCDDCKAKVEMYKNVIIVIKEQSHAKFDFNVSKLVLTKIELKKSEYLYVFWLLNLLGIGVMVITVFFFEKHIANMFSGVSEMASYLVVTTSVVLLLFQGREIIRKYKRQLDAINFS